MFEIVKEDKATRARIGRLYTKAGIIETPVFMPVGTQATVKTLSPHELYEIGVDIILANAYHLYLRPGNKLVKSFGGLHKFMNWKRAILTDSGGYQIFSISDFVKVKDEGVYFKSHIDGSSHFLSPEDVIDIQLDLSSDIMMVLDECVSYPVEYEVAKKAKDRTSLWAKRSKERFDRVGETEEKKGSLLFAIIQGSTYLDLRKQSAEELLLLDFPGYALGGLSVGEPREITFEILKEVISFLPKEKPRYLMGVGKPEEIIAAVKEGVDMFDCILPTRLGRFGVAFTSYGKIHIKNAEYKKDERPLDEKCKCFVCQNFSRAYLRHLYKAGEILVMRLLTYHNIYFYVKLMEEIKDNIRNNVI